MNGPTKIGVFDSGIGGKAVAKRLEELLPDAEIICIDDHEHVPYGNRAVADIIQLTNVAIRPLIDAKCDAIVIACNTVTTVAISHLRETYPEMNFVGIEPMIKPAAAQTKSGKIAVLATPVTLASSSYDTLKKTWAHGITVIEPDTSRWAALIEAGKSDEVPIEDTIFQLIEQNVDVIVLACTHYHWLKERAKTAAGVRAIILEPTDAIGNRIISLLGSEVA
jgi:glutamate racemase